MFLITVVPQCSGVSQKEAEMSSASTKQILALLKVSLIIFLYIYRLPRQERLALQHEFPLFCALLTLQA